MWVEIRVGASGVVVGFAPGAPDYRPAAGCISIIEYTTQYEPS
jgi:hypothetical protein